MIRIIVTLLFLLLLSSSFAQAQGLMCAGIFSSGESQSAPSIPTLHFAELTKVESAGRGNLSAFYGAEKIFLKKLRNNSTNEALWLQSINSLGLGVKLHGILHLENQLYMAIENAPGINTQMPMLAPESFVLTKSMVQDIKRQAEILANQGIVPVDLQFQANKDTQEVKIVDPELFRSVENIEIARQETDKIVRGLLMPWIMEGRLE